MTVTEATATQQLQGDTMKKRKHHEVDNEEGSETLHVVVRRVGKAENESLKLELESGATVLDLKEKIAEALEEQDEIVIPVERQRLIFSGKMLRDESLSLESDLNMKAGDDHKHFVHLTPLPKGAAPSVRTERELSESQAPTQQVTLQRTRPRQRRRRRQEPRPGMSDPAAYHPYALDLASGSLMPTASVVPVAAAAASLASPSAAEAALLSMAAAAEQSRLVQEVASRSEALQAVMLAQQHQALLAAAASNPTLNVAAFCPLGTDALHQLLTGRTPALTFQGPTSTEAMLHELLARQQQQQQQPREQMLPEILEQIAANAGELANTLRLLSPPAAALRVQQQQQMASDLARRLLLEERLASLSSGASSSASLLPGSFPGFF